MSSEQHTRASEIFLAVCDLDPREQATRLRAQCGADEDLARLVEGMLAAESSAKVLDQPAAAQYMPAAGAAEAPRRLGPFTILKELGRGGMGVCYEAQQDHPERRVALKLVPAVLASSGVLRRFEHEAHVLGWLNHPGIAQIYEAGVAPSPTGPQPFFAMELVDGQPLTDYADKHGLDLHERLALLERVCHAVHHAHQKGVVHRDLKPSNILVDATGAPKVLDFGIARAIDSDPEASFATRTGDWLGTASYMSPEQMEADPAELDTRSDVYSLGVIAYRLATGRLPHDLNRLPISEALRVLREEEPDPPSRVVGSLAGDVETVLHKALAKDKAERYSSAEAFADDLRRILDHQPVSARPPSTLYQLRKFARRNRLLVGASATVIVVLIAATIFSVIAAVDESRAARLAEAGRLEAERQMAIASAVNDFLNYDIIASVRPDELGRTVTVREALDAAAATVESRFADQPEVGAEVSYTIANTYLALGDYDLAEPLFLRALELRERLLGPQHESTVQSYNGLGRLMMDLGRLDDAEIYIRRCLEIRRDQLGPGHELTLTSQNNLTGLMRQLGQLEDALELASEAAILAEQSLSPDHHVLLSVIEGQAGAYKDMRRMDEATPLYTRIYETHRRIPSSAVDIARAANNLAVAYMIAGRMEEAEVLLEEAVELGSESLGEDHSYTIAYLTNLARVTGSLGQHDLADERFLRALELAGAVNGADHRGTLITTVFYAELLCSAGRLEDAATILVEAHELALERYGAGFTVTARCAARLAEIYDELGRPELAEEWRSKRSPDEAAQSR